MNRTLLAGAGVVVALGAGALLLSEKPDTKPTRENTTKAVTEKLDKGSRIYQDSAPSTKQAIDLTLSLFARREKGDEPTVEEWAEAETAIDELRGIEDSPELQRIDRLIEVADAAPEFISAELQKI